MRKPGERVNRAISSLDTGAKRIFEDAKRRSLGAITEWSIVAALSADNMARVALALGKEIAWQALIAFPEDWLDEDEEVVGSEKGIMVHGFLLSESLIPVLRFALTLSHLQPASERGSITTDILLAALGVKTLHAGGKVFRALKLREPRCARRRAINEVGQKGQSAANAQARTRRTK